MVKSGHKGPNSSDNTKQKTQSDYVHWSKSVKKVILDSRGADVSITLDGGSDKGEFIYVSEINVVLYATEETLRVGDIVLEIQNKKVSGFTRKDAVSWLRHWSSSPVTLRCVSEGNIGKSLRQFLSARFQKGCVDHHLQSVVRDNLYMRTVPVTTRSPRPYEADGIDYTFLSLEKFIELERNGDLLESGVYKGNHYGTPKPSENWYSELARHNGSVTPLEETSKSSPVLPGIHPSSEGKRKRNRSNVEAMASKNLECDSGEESSKERFDDGGRGSPPSYFSGENMKYSLPTEDDEDDGLGPLPPKWEKAYTDKGEVYFIDHNSSTSHWLDPRLSRIQKKSLEDCSEDELPFGWERIDDPLYGTYYIDHVNRQTQYENPVIQAKNRSGDVKRMENLPNGGPSYRVADNRSDSVNQSVRNENYASEQPYFFTTDPNELVGERIHSTLVKSYKGLGFTIVGGDDTKDEFLQIKSVVKNGPAWFEGKLQTGDVLVYVNRKCVLGYTHHDMVSVFQSIAPGETVDIEVCRGYPLPFDPNDPNTEVVTTVAVGGNAENGIDLNAFMEQEMFLKRNLVETDTNDLTNQSVKSMPDIYASEKILNVGRPTSTNLVIDGDECGSEYLTVSIVKGAMGFGFTIADSAYGQKVKKILDTQRCKTLMEGDVLVEINNACVRNMCHSEVVQVLKDCPKNQEAAITVERSNFRLPEETQLARNVRTSSIGRSKTPVGNGQFENKPPILSLSDVQFRPKTPNSLSDIKCGSERYEVESNVTAHTCYSRSHSPGNGLDQVDNGMWTTAKHPISSEYRHHELNYMSDTIARNSAYYNASNADLRSGCAQDSNENCFYQGSISSRKEDNFELQPMSPGNVLESCKLNECNWSPSGYNGSPAYDVQYTNYVVTVFRQEAGFGFRIVGGTEEGSQVSIGHIVEGGAAERDGRLRSGDEIVSVDYQPVMNSSHHRVVQLMSKAALNGKVTLQIRRKVQVPKDIDRGIKKSELRYPYDVTVTRREDEGFGFVIISSLSRAGSTIGRIIEGSPAERCSQLNLGDHIIAVNHVNIMNLHHGEIVNLIKDSGYSVTLTIGSPLDDSSSGASVPVSYKEEEPEEEQYYAVEINRGSRGFGFSIRGGKEFKNMDLFVLQIAENGPAAADGRLKVGDRLIEINGVSTKDMTHAQAIEIIRNGGPSVRLLVQRGGRVPPLPSEEQMLCSANSQYSSTGYNGSGRQRIIPNGRPACWDPQISST